MAGYHAMSHGLTQEKLEQLLPSNLSKLAKDTGACQRWRKLGNGKDYLWLCLIYAQALMSLRATACLSIGFANITEASVLHRLRQAGPFLSAILCHLLDRPISNIERKGFKTAIRLHDATTLSVRGSKGSDWRIHTVYIPNQGITSIEVTDCSGSESLDRGEYQPGDIVVADQGLCRARDVHHVHAVRALSLMRVYLPNIRLDLDAAGTRFDLEDALKRADIGDISTVVWVPFKKQKLKARVLIFPPSEAKAQIAKKKLLQKASRKQTQFSEQAMRLAGYFCLLTTVDSSLMSHEELIQIYRLRWQIELLFKRWKSILRLDTFACDEPALVRTYILSKLIEAVIIEKLSAEEVSLSVPNSAAEDSISAIRIPSCSIWRMTVIYRTQFQLALFSAHPIPDENWQKMNALCREGRRRRRCANEGIENVLINMNSLKIAA